MASEYDQYDRFIEHMMKMDDLDRDVVRLDQTEMDRIDQIQMNADLTIYDPDIYHSHCTVVRHDVCHDVCPSPIAKSIVSTKPKTLVKMDGGFQSINKYDKKLTTSRIEKMVLKNAKHLKSLVQCDSSSHVNFFDQMISQLNSLLQVEMFQISYDMETENMNGLRESENRLGNIMKFIETNNTNGNNSKKPNELLTGTDGNIRNIENLTLDNLFMLGDMSSSNRKMKQIITSHENKNSQELMELFSKQLTHSFSDFHVGLSNYQFLLHFGCDHLQSHYEVKYNQSLWGLDGSHAKFKKFNKLMTDLDNTRNYIDEYFLKVQEIQYGIHQMTKLIGDKIKTPSVVSNKKVKQLLMKNVQEMNQIVHQHFTPNICDRVPRKKLTNY